MSENQKELSTAITIDNKEFEYLKNIVTFEEVCQEIDDVVKDFNGAAFTSTFDPKLGAINSHEAMLKLIQDLIERFEEKSPDPEEDPFITKMYSLYEAIASLTALSRIILCIAGFNSQLLVLFLLLIDSPSGKSDNIMGSGCFIYFTV